MPVPEPEPAMRERPPHLTGPAIPDVPTGTLLRLAPGEWSHCHAVPAGSRLDVTVSRVHRNVVRRDEAGLWVWVVGHEHPACGWAHVERHPPCRQLMVRVDVLARAVAS
ncbi:hypothetical protein EF879_03410 [Micromonospora sp. HM5-17]|nr:hypothetical protein EF879_03410 [Micromonospora sp. HM5-17]